MNLQHQPVSAFATALFAGASFLSAAHAAPVDFQRDIQPFFAEHCLECHGADKAKGGLALTSRGGALKKLESGAPGIVPGNPGASEIVARLETEHGDDKMPPLKKAKRPSSAEIEKVKRWVSEGANWAEHWAYRPVAKASAAELARPSEHIDALVRRRLQKEGIAPAPEAPPHTLLKRVYYDLLGLPPSEEEAAAFLNDRAPGAYSRMVERALASPHFGERWGRHWLDQARYADSDGYEKDSPRPDAWRYRDWVIRAVNEDLPLDQFTIEQLAGDLLEKPAPEQVLATAFHRQTLTNREGGVDQEQYRVEAVFDRTETTGSVWLGLTVGCARCHSHKYDQLSQREYYQMFAFFNGADETTAKVGVSKEELERFERANANHLASLEALRARYAAARVPLAGGLLDWEREMQRRLRELADVRASEVVLKTAKRSSLQKADLTEQPDGAIRVNGAQGPTDTYSLECELPEGVVSGFKLEVLPDDTLPAKGPGLHANGNFVLTKFHVAAAQAEGGASADAEWALHSPKASFTQPGFPPEATLDEDAQTGWAIMGGTGKAQNIVFRLVRPVRAQAGQKVVITLEQGYSKNGKHLLGRFRLSALLGETVESLLPPDLKRLVDTGSEKWTNEQKESLIDWLARLDPNASAARLALTRAEASGPRPPVMEVRVLAQRAGGRETRMFHRGEFLSPADPVGSGTPAILPPLRARREGSAPDRLDFARWLVDTQNPLPARVLANQIWMRLFGEGLVRSVGDFGVRGDAPTHPELLDFLAAALPGRGWSRKELIRAIVHSATYRQSSENRRELAEIDPLNRLLARQNRLRVEGEVVRDLHLAAAGLLSRKIGGPSVFPPMPPEIASLSYAGNFRWTESKGEDRYRRGMYTFFKRTAPYPDLVTFDCPDANVTSVRRSVSNTPLQALTTLNAETFAEAAKALAKRVMASVPAKSAEAAVAPSSVETASNDSARIGFLFRTCLLREPEAREAASLLKLLASSRRAFEAQPSDAEKFAGNPELAAWTALSRVVLNTDEFITRD